MPPGIARVRLSAAERQEAKYRSQFARERDAAEQFVISFPKSGRTWHRALLGSYLAYSCGEPLQHAFDLERLCSLAKCRRTVYSHNGANFIDGLPPSSDVIASPELWQGRPVILLVRDPREILVSAYHHARFRRPISSGSISEFVRDPRTGIEKIMTAFVRWQSCRHLASELDVVSYRAMHRDPGAVLRQTLSTVGVPAIDESLITSAAHACRFEAMQDYERSGFFETSRMENKSNDPRGAKVREGRIGAFRDHLSEADLAYIDQVIQSADRPFESFY